MIEFKDIDVRFQARILFHRFNLKVKAGEKVLIYGPSGSGKSTLFRLLLGFAFPDQGDIYFQNHPLDRKHVWHLRSQCGYVSQEPDFGEGRVESFFKSFFHFHHNRHLKFEPREAIEWAVRFRLPEDILSKKIEALSGGEKQRIALILPMLLKRTLFLLDEATTGLEDDLTREIVRLFADHSGWTVLSISHDKNWLNESNFRVVGVGGVDGSR